MVDVYRANRTLKVNSVLQLGDNGRQLARILADEIAAKVDAILEDSDHA